MGLNIFQREPALITSAVTVILSVGAAWGFHLDAEKTSAVMAVATLVAGIITRSQVTPTANVAVTKDGSGMK